MTSLPTVSTAVTSSPAVDEPSADTRPVGAGHPFATLPLLPSRGTHSGGVHAAGCHCNTCRKATKP